MCVYTCDFKPTARQRTASGAFRMKKDCAMSLIALTYFRKAYACLPSAFPHDRGSKNYSVLSVDASLGSVYPEVRTRAPMHNHALVSWQARSFPLTHVQVHQLGTIELLEAESIEPRVIDRIRELRMKYTSKALPGVH